MRIVASLTTLPGRIQYIRPIILSILNQSRPVEQLYINIPRITLKGKKYQIPKWLIEMRTNGLLRIIRCKDYGPITKLLPVLKHEKNSKTLIITFDDDVLIERHVIEIFEKKANEHTNCALSFSGWRVGRFPCTHQLLWKNLQDVKVDWLQGVHGFAYRRSMLSLKKILKLIKQYSYLRFHDDHTMSIYLSRNGIDRIAIGGKAKYYFVDANHRNISAISGSSFLGTVRFLTDVYSISMRHQKLGDYNHSVSLTNSIAIRGSLFLFLIILFFNTSQYFLAIGLIIFGLIYFEANNQIPNCP